MAGVNNCLKYSMFVFNFLFWLCGILILALAIWLRVSKFEEEARCMKRFVQKAFPSPGCQHQFSFGTWDPGLPSGQSLQSLLRSFTHRQIEEFSGRLSGLCIFWEQGDRIDMKYQFVSEDGGMHPYVAVNILIAVGSIIMILGFLGCCGAMKESRCMLLVFFICLLLILLLQVAAGILGVTYRSEYEQALNETLHKNVELLRGTDEKAKSFQKNLIDFQKEFKCCGLVDGASDWGQNFQANSESCECSDTSDSQCTLYDGKYVYQQACITLIEGILKKNLLVIIGLAFGIAFIEIDEINRSQGRVFGIISALGEYRYQILGLVFSMILFCQIGNK